MGATVDMHQIYDAHIHQEDGAPFESIPFALKKHVPDPSLLVRHPCQRSAAAQEWSAGLYWPGTLAHLPVLYDGVQASPVPTMFTPTIAFEPNKGIREVVDCAL